MNKEEYEQLNWVEQLAIFDPFVLAMWQAAHAPRIVPSAEQAMDILKKQTDLQNIKVEREIALENYRASRSVIKEKEES